jgi:tetratricopeptide (TPR) repeat protein
MSKKNLIKKAHQLKKEGKFDEAASIYRELIKQSPNLYFVHNNIAEILAVQGYLDESVNEYKKAIEINPNSALSYYKSGKILLESKRDNEAIECFYQAVKLNPKQYILRKKLSDVLAKKGCVKEAIAELQVAIQIDPSFSIVDQNILRELNFRLNIGDSISYWENRYKKGGNSGAGSLGNLAKFKAQVLNDLVIQENIKSIIDFGCGDGNQLQLAKYPMYIGLDVSKTAIVKCEKLFQGDLTKSFFLYDPLAFFNKNKFFKADLTTSIDVLFHLIEDEIYFKYLDDLFGSAQRIVAIYSWNFTGNAEQFALHCLPRNFTKDIEKRIQGWQLGRIIKNPYPLEKYGNQEGSYSDFYLYYKTDL